MRHWFLNRRALLTRAAVAGGLVWVAPFVRAEPARADSGTPKCRPALGSFALTLAATRGGSTSTAEACASKSITFGWDGATNGNFNDTPTQGTQSNNVSC